MRRQAGVAVLLFILIVDLMGFTLIFPLVPDMLSYYLTAGDFRPIDAWVPDFLALLLRVSPEFSSSTDRIIVLSGGVLGALYALLQFLVSPYWGRLSDRIGRKPVLMLTSIGLAFAYLLWGISTTFTFFLFSRVLAGIMAGNLGVATAAMADLSDEAGRTKSMGLVGAAFGVGFVLGPAMGGALARLSVPGLMAGAMLHPFSAAALASLVLSASSAILNFFFLRETLPIDLRSAALRLRIESPLRALSELPEPRFRQTLFLNFFFTVLFASFESTVTFLYSLEFRLGPRSIGLIFAYLGVLLVFGQGFLARQLSGIVSEKRMILWGFLLVALSLVPLAMSAPVVGLSLIALIPLAMGNALLQPALAGLASRAISRERQGLAMGSFRSVASLARAVGPLFGAWLYGSIGILFAYSTISGLLLVGFLFALLLPPAEPV